MYTCTVSIAVKLVLHTCTVSCNKSDLESVGLVNISDKAKMRMMERNVTLVNAKTNFIKHIRW